MYVVKVYRGAVVFWKNTYYDWAQAVMEFANYKGGFYTHIVLEVICDRFSETWIKLCPCPKLEEGGEKNE